MKLLNNILIVLLLTFISCNRNKDNVIEEEEHKDPNYEYGTYDSTAHLLAYPSYVSQPYTNNVNPLTKKGILLGRKLFYDPIISSDSSVSCANCHKQEKAFTSRGVRFRNTYKGLTLERNSMALFNDAWDGHFAWDNREDILEEKVIASLNNPHGINGNSAIVFERLLNHPDYPRHVFEAFNSYNINEEVITNALAQFIRSITSFNSKFDQYLQGLINLEDEELLGYQIYATEKGDCFHCHNPEGGLFQLDQAQNNGLDSSNTTTGFDDYGYGNVSNNEFDNGKFKATSIRNIGFTAPYMHDGRFQTLREVLDHYNAGGHFSPSVSPTLKYIGNGLQLTEEQLDHLEAFLVTLNDSSLLTDTTYSNPFTE